MNGKACSGECRTHNECVGEVHTVWVEGNGYTGAYFDYCQRAVSEDLRRGFRVLSAQDGGAVPTPEGTERRQGERRKRTVVL